MKRMYRISCATLACLCLALLGAGSARADIYIYSAELTASGVVPPTSSTALGTATITIDQGVNYTTASLHLEFTGLSSSQTAASINYASPGSNGPVLFNLGLGSPLDVNLSPTLFQLAIFANALNNGTLYATVGSTNFPGGEIRGHFVLTNTVAAEVSSWGAIKMLYRD